MVVIEPEIDGKKIGPLTLNVHQSEGSSQKLPFQTQPFTPLYLPKDCHKTGFYQHKAVVTQSAKHPEDLNEANVAAVSNDLKVIREALIEHPWHHGLVLAGLEKVSSDAELIDLFDAFTKGCRKNHALEEYYLAVTHDDFDPKANSLQTAPPALQKAASKAGEFYSKWVAGDK